jgi:nitronate monooxygenase
VSIVLESLTVPIIQAPMAGGPSTPALAAAVGRAGGLGFLAAGYLTPERLKQDISTTRSQIDRFGVNVFAPGGEPADPSVVQEYAERLQPEVQRTGIALGRPRFDDDAFNEKIDSLSRDPVATVSFTFGIPPECAIERIHAAGAEVWITVTSPGEARRAASAGADALIVQGVEAGGHRGILVDDDSQSDLTLLAALQLVRRAVGLPLIGAGSIATGEALAAVLVAGATAAQVGTAYLLAAEAGTSPAQRAATATETPTVLTRAFTGRLARGIRNRLHGEHGDAAPHAYPEIHHLTSPLRAHAREVGDADLINLWAGQTHSLAQARSAEEITRGLAKDARDALSAAIARLQ